MSVNIRLVNIRVLITQTCCILITESHTSAHYLGSIPMYRVCTRSYAVQLPPFLEISSKNLLFLAQIN